MNRETQRGFPSPLKATRVLDQLRERIRYLHYSIRTEDAYVYCVRAFIRFLVLSNRQAWRLPMGTWSNGLVDRDLTLSILAFLACEWPLWGAFVTVRSWPRTAVKNDKNALNRACLDKPG